MPRRFTWSYALLGALVLAPPVDGQVSGPHRRSVERIEANLRAQDRPDDAFAIQERMEHYAVPGVSVAVMYGGQIVWAKGYGVKNLASFDPVEPETLFQSASISKPVAGLAALRLVERGVLDLDEDVNRYLTSWQLPSEGEGDDGVVTLRGILSHTAGLTQHGFPGYATGEELPTIPQILDGVPPANTDAVRSFGPPGVEWRYSGGGYTILQQLLVDVTGQDFPTLMDELVISPLMLGKSTYEQPLPSDRWEEAAHAHGPDGEPIAGWWHTYPEMAAAGLWTTPFELLRISMEVQRSVSGQVGSFLSEPLANEMLTPGMNDWGLGFTTGSGPQARFGHGGSNAGFKAEWSVFIERGMGVAVMTNGERGGALAQEIIDAVAAEYRWTTQSDRPTEGQSGWTGPKPGARR